MSDVLTGPVLAAAGLVCVTAVAKLRRPDGAVRALGALGLPARAWAVWALCGVELAAGAGALLAPAPASLAVLAGLYVTFAGAGAALRGRGVGCGCFGDDGGGMVPVSIGHVAICAALAITCAAGGLWPPHGTAWVLERPVLALGIAGCVYALAIAFVELPVAWGAWRAQ